MSDSCCSIHSDSRSNLPNPVIIADEASCVSYKSLHDVVGLSAVSPGGEGEAHVAGSLALVVSGGTLVVGGGGGR